MFIVSLIEKYWIWYFKMTVLFLRLEFFESKNNTFRTFSRNLLFGSFWKKIFGFSRWIFDSFCWSLLPGGGACGLIALSLSARPLHFFFLSLHLLSTPITYSKYENWIRDTLYRDNIYEDFVRSRDQKVKSEEEKRSKWLTGTNGTYDLNSHVPSSSPFAKSNSKFWPI